MFDQIEWSTERVLGQTVRRAKEIGLKVKMLPRGYDVDDRTGLQRLCTELLGENSPLDSGIAPYTREFLSRIIKREGRARIWPA
jgi:hypothetical protein